MLRIGVAASKMSKDSVLTYNMYVVLIATLFSFLVFAICASCILMTILLVSWMIHIAHPHAPYPGWVHMLKISLLVLAMVIGVFNLIAIMKNIQMSRI